MSDLGHIAVLAALLLSAYAVCAALCGAFWRAPELAVSARRAVIAVCLLLSLASGTLLWAFLNHDFSLRYVAERSSLAMPPQLIAAAFYSGQQGSLLFWAWTLAIFSTIVIVRHRNNDPELMPFVIAVLMGIEAFFALMLGFVASPFERSLITPRDGVGLNPLLYDTGMLYHPPMLLMGYMSWSVPFAFAVAALASGRLDARWIRATRTYALVAWLILGIGNLLGGWWAYHVLGWGGYWGWDPVENAAIMPWFLGTAYLHSVMIQERRGMLKVWNLVLLLTTFCLCIFGTFVVRSGVISSVHSFATSNVGPYYLILLLVATLGSVSLLLWRMPQLRSDSHLESMLSREASFVLNNLLFVGITFAIFWGTIFPLASEALQGTRLTVGPPYFNQTVGPLLLVLVLLMGIGPLMPWRRSNPRALARSFTAPVAAGVLAALGGAALGANQPWAVAGVFVCIFSGTTIVSEFVRGVRARRSTTGEGPLVALAGLVRRNRRRYGGYVVHAGVIMAALAIVASSAYQLEQHVSLRPGERAQIGRYTLVFEGLRERAEPGIRIVEAGLTVIEYGRPVETVHPAKNFHRGFERQPNSHIPIRTTPQDDLYVVLAGWESDGSASFSIFLNPLVVWIWVGGVLLLGGTVITLWPERYGSVATVSRPAGVLSPGSAS